MITLPLPNVVFAINGCGNHPEVHEWLRNNNITIRPEHTRKNNIRVSFRIRSTIGWNNVPYSLGEVILGRATELVLTPEDLFPPTLSNEEILHIFLKHHRKLTLFKRITRRALFRNNVERIFLHDIPELNQPWRDLIDKFNLTGEINLIKFRKL